MPLSGAEVGETLSSPFPWRARKTTERIIVHSSHTKAGVDVVPWLRVRGRANGWLDIGYHFVIERDGRIVRTRPIDALGTHAQQGRGHTPGHNHDSIGICVASDHDWRVEDYPRQWASLLALLREVHHMYPGIPVFGHDEACTTRNKDGSVHHCPDFSMDRLRKELD